MTVRPPTPGDAPRLAAVHIETWQQAYDGIFPERFLHELDMEGRRQWFASRIERAAEGLLVADAGSGPVGFCLFGEATEPGWGEVYAIYVHPEHWGDGHGTELLSAAETHLSVMGFERALLWVLERNLQAREFYQRRGWVLGRPIKIEEIGGTQVTEVRYERVLPGPVRRGEGRRDR